MLTAVGIVCDDFEFDFELLCFDVSDVSKLYSQRMLTEHAQTVCACSVNIRCE